jgi:hypothetical protein
MHRYSFSTQLMYFLTPGKADLINVVSVKEVLVHLSKIYVVEGNFGNETLSEFSKKTRTILEKMEIRPITQIRASVMFIYFSFMPKTNK